MDGGGGERIVRFGGGKRTIECVVHKFEASESGDWSGSGPVSSEEHERV